PGGPARAEACPRCGTLRIGRFCEACGFNFAAASGRHASPRSARPGSAGPGRRNSPPSGAPGPAAPAAGAIETFPYSLATWIVVVGADRAYYDQVQAVTGPEGAVVEVPAYCAER